MIFYYMLVSVMPMVRHPLWSGFVGDLTIIKYLGVACLVYMMMYLPSRRSLPQFFQTSQARWFVFLALFGMASFALMGPQIEWELSPFMNYASFLMLLIITLVLVDSIERLRWVLLTAIGGVAYASLHVLREWQKNSGMSFGYRPGWVTGDPNYFTLSALLCLPIAVYLLRTQQSRPERWFCIGAIVLMLCAITLAASRGGFLGLIAALLVFVWHSKQRVRSLLCTGVFFLLMVIIPASPLSRLLHPDLSDKDSSDSRTILWDAGLRMFQEHFLVGIGAGSFKPLVVHYLSPGENVQGIAHNTYLEIATELGLPGLVAFLAILLGSFRTLERLRGMADSSIPLLIPRTAESFQAGLIGYAVAAFFVSAEYQKLFWLIVFLTMLLPSLARHSLQGPDSQSQQDRHKCRHTTQ